MPYVLWLFTGIAILSIAWWIFENGTAQRRRMRELAASMPGPKGWPVLGNALLFMTKPEALLSTIVNVLDTYGEYCRLWLGPELLVMVKNPADIRLILTSNKINLKGPMYEFIKRLLGPGILSEGGPVWRNHRRIAAPSFNRKGVQKYNQVFNVNAGELADTLTMTPPRGTFDIYHYVVQYTTMCVCQSIIGLSKEEAKRIKSMDEVVKLTHKMYDFIFTNMTHWWYHIPLIYWLLGRTKIENDYMRLIDEMTSDMVAKRTAALKLTTPEDLSVVDRMILSGELTEQEIKWETMTFFTASQEASAKIASMTLLILAHLPEWQEKVYNEITELLDPEDEYVSDEQLKKLKMLDLVYKEAIRLMPIGAFIQRTVEEEVAINNGNITLPTGASVVIPIYAVHRDPRYWEDPYKIDPSRFLPENSSKRDPNAFVPFSLGAMDCIGRSLGESLIKIVVVRLVRRIQLKADGKIEDLDLNVAVSVKMAKGYNVRVKPRETYCHNGVINNNQ